MRPHHRPAQLVERAVCVWLAAEGLQRPAPLVAVPPLLAERTATVPRTAKCMRAVQTGIKAAYTSIQEAIAPKLFPRAVTATSGCS